VRVHAETAAPLPGSLPATVEEPCIEHAALAAGHDGFPELALRIRFGNGACSDVIIDNAAGLRLMSRCRADSIEALVGHSWREVRNALLEE
jgi:hypothetical protein